MSTPLSDLALDQLFRTARTYNAFEDRDVPQTLLRATYELTKLGSTSANCSPARFVFVGSAEGKARLKPLLAPGNVEKTMSAPWTVIIATDRKYYDQVPALFPHAPQARDWFLAGGVEASFEAGFRNGTLQGGYLMLAARALGLDCGPMSGFDVAGVDKEFLSGTDWTANFLCNLGYGKPGSYFERLPRLDFEQACQIV